MTKNTFFLQLRFHLNIHNCKHKQHIFNIYRDSREHNRISNRWQTSTEAGREKRQVKVVIHGKSAQDGCRLSLPEMSHLCM